MKLLISILESQIFTSNLAIWQDIPSSFLTIGVVTKTNVYAQLLHFL
jgi:hypothetical protein